MTISLMAVNLVAVLAASIVAMIIGALWYGPLFGKTWAKLMGIKKDKKKGMGKGMTAMFIALLITNFVLAHLLAFAGVTTMTGALALGFLVWLGFYATTMLGSVLWEGKPHKLYTINVVHYLVVLLVSSAILVSM